MSDSSAEKRPLRIAILGTRGIPANYGGFETFAEELSTRLSARGHQVVVYGRPRYVDRRLRYYRGVEIRVLPCVPQKHLETVTHTSLCVIHSLLRRPEIILICNAANAFLAWIPRLRGSRTVLNVDGIERQRKKWGLLGKVFHLGGEYLATQLPDRTVTDARSIQSYYRERYGFSSTFIPYGAGIEPEPTSTALDELGIRPRQYLLYVSRLEPENNAHLVIEGYLRSGVAMPLVLVGQAPYSRRYVARLRRLAEKGNVLMPGAIYGQSYRELLSHCTAYFQATEVGGTHPALVEAMGVGALILVHDTPENREVVADTAWVHPFQDSEGLARLIRSAVENPGRYDGLREKARRRARLHYDWEEITRRYEALFCELAGTAVADVSCAAEEV